MRKVANMRIRLLSRIYYCLALKLKSLFNQANKSEINHDKNACVENKDKFIERVKLVKLRLQLIELSEIRHNNVCNGRNTVATRVAPECSALFVASVAISESSRL